MAFFNLVYDIIVVSGATFIGVTSAFILVSQFVYEPAPRIQDLEAATETEQEFEELYQSEFDEMENSELPSSEIISSSFVSNLKTPLGEVIMKYDTETKAFQYYTDARNIPVRFLNVCARHFVVVNECKALYEQEEQIETENNNSEQDEEETELEVEMKQSYYDWICSYFSKNVERPSTPPLSPVPLPVKFMSQELEESVFANYKKKPEMTNTKDNLIEKTMNKYKWCGTLKDFEEKSEEKNDESLQVSFTKFKEMVKNKTE